MRILSKTLALLGSIAVIGFSSCDNSDDNPVTPSSVTDTNFTVATTYDTASFNTDIANSVASTISTGLGTLSSKMKSGDPTQSTRKKLDYTNDLKGLETAISSEATGYYKALLPAFLMQLANASSSSAMDTIDLSSSVADTNFVKTQGDGGAFYKHLVDEYATEMEQLVEKGLFGAMQYNRVANTLLTADYKQADLSKALVLLGTDPIFKQAKWTAKYAANSYDGFKALDSLHYYFKMAQAGLVTDVVAGQKAHAVKMIKKHWERALIAQTIHYLNDASKTFSNTSATYDEKADAIHVWSEAVGFVLGFYGVQNKEIISDTDISSILTKMGANVPATTATDDFGMKGYKFITNPTATDIANLNEAKKALGALIGASDVSSF